MLEEILGSFSSSPFSNLARLEWTSLGFRKTSVLPHQIITRRLRSCIFRNCSMSFMTSRASWRLFLAFLTWRPVSRLTYLRLKTAFQGRISSRRGRSSSSCRGSSTPERTAVS